MKTSRGYSNDINLIQALPANGIYTLIIFLSKEVCLNVGKLGMRKFPKGYYTYTGSALGKGGSSLKCRVSRHLRKWKRNLWHIDFLLANENAVVTAVVAMQTSKKLECNMNLYIKKEGEAKIPVKGFGASDCKENCESHLLYFGEEDIKSKIAMFYAKRLGLSPSPSIFAKMARSEYFGVQKSQIPLLSCIKRKAEW